MPYQIHATDAQFHQAYPKAKALFALKQQLDPNYTFRNRLWERYFPPEKAQAEAEIDAEISTRLLAREDINALKNKRFHTPRAVSGVQRHELGAHLDHQRPSTFRISQYLSILADLRLCMECYRGRYAFDWGTHSVIWAKGVGFTAEYMAKGV